jgi:hypothetical protein
VRCARSAGRREGVPSLSGVSAAFAVACACTFIERHQESPSRQQVTQRFRWRLFARASEGAAHAEVAPTPRSHVPSRRAATRSARLRARCRGRAESARASWAARAAPPSMSPPPARPRAGHDRVGPGELSRRRRALGQEPAHRRALSALAPRPGAPTIRAVGDPFRRVREVETGERELRLSGAAEKCTSFAQSKSAPVRGELISAAQAESRSDGA